MASSTPTVETSWDRADELVAPPVRMEVAGDPIGEEREPVDAATPAWIVSMVLHAVLVIVLAFIPLRLSSDAQVVRLVTPVAEEEEPQMDVPEEFTFDEQLNEEIGAKSLEGTEMAMAMAPEVLETPEVVLPSELIPTDRGDIQINLTEFKVNRGLQYSNLPVKGHVGDVVKGTEGAIERLTHEILLSLEERKTLVVWILDQSPSLSVRRGELRERFERIYEELGLMAQSGHKAFQHDDKPLLSAIIGFGEKVTLRTKEPTDDLNVLRKAIDGLERDDSGIERVFSAIYAAAQQFKSFREINPRTGEPERNVMLIVVTDEAGDDQEGLEETVQLCRRYEMPVYVLGTPAPFGRRETVIVWQDPDPNYDQTPRPGRIDAGPESLLQERLRLRFPDPAKHDEFERLHSGFGPFALTRLCYETGGIFMSIHPNFSVENLRPIRFRETAPYSIHFTHFFDPEIMRKYRPDYVSREEYMRRLMQNKCRKALVEAAKISEVGQLEAPQTRFVKRDEAAFANALTEAQKAAAKLEPQLNMLYQTLKLGEVDREKETSLRWQAGYDLAMGRVLAAKVRTETYNAMLALAKRGLKFSNPKNNVWRLVPADEISTGSLDKKMAEEAKMYLERVVRDHPGTPWALIAQAELEIPLGWKWVEEYEAPPEERRNMRPNNNNNNPRPARNDERRMIQRKPSRPVPKRL